MKDLFLAIVNIFKYAGRFFAVLRNLLFNLLLVAVLILIAIAFIPGQGRFIPANSILRLDISGDIVEERRSASALERYLGDGEPDAPSETVLQDILDVIAAAAADDRITVLLLNLKHLNKAGLNELQAIGQALDDFKQSGKPIIAAEDYYSQAQYFIAAHADKVAVNPMGAVDIHGFGVFRLYFHDALDRLAVNYNIFKVGAFKSALEPFTRNSMSPEDREQNQQWLSALWQTYTEEIVKKRKVSRKALELYTHDINAALAASGGNPALLAQKIGLVDHLWNKPQITEFLAGLTKTPEKDLHTVSSIDYYETIEPSYSRTDDSETGRIGLVVAEGTMLPGRQPPGFIGGETLAGLLKKAVEDDGIKAVVLRVNSGGGSAFAAEVIRQEILRLKKKGKPVVVSMGSVAASGGYWIAADANQIWAADTTITGSIGIFGAIPTFEDTLAKLGIHSDGIGTTPLSSALDLTQPLPEQLKGAIQQGIEYNYNQFLDIVASGRNMSKSRVAELAQGRVYDGRAAQKLGLVDKLGTLDDALEAAADLAGIEKYETEYLAPPESLEERILKFFTSAAPSFSVQWSSPLLGKLKQVLASRMNTYLMLDDPRGIYAQCPITLML